MMVYKTFFAKNRLNPVYKKPVNVTNAQIHHYADSLFVHKDSLKITDDDIMSNKRIIIENGDTLGFAFIVYEPIPCPSCSDINYLLITDKKYKIQSIIFLRNIIEDYKIFPKDIFISFINRFINRNIKNENLAIMHILVNQDFPQNNINYFIQSIIKVNKQVRFFNEQ
jgi:hypothetical protein